MKGGRMVEKYEIDQIINVFSDPVLIVQNETIVLANQAALTLQPQMVGMPLNELLKTQTFDPSGRVEAIMRGIPKNKPALYPIKTKENQLKWFEVVSSKMLYKNEPAIISHAKDVTDKHHLLTQTHLFKKWFMIRKMPRWEGALVKTIYQNHHKGFMFFSDDSRGNAWGILGEIDQVDLSSIMILSALEVFFREMIEIKRDFLYQLQWLNEKTHVYFSNTSFKAIVLKFNSKKQVVKGVNMGGLPLYTVDSNNCYQRVRGNAERLGESNNLDFKSFVIKSNSEKYLIGATSGKIAVSPEFFPENIYHLSNKACHNEPTTYLCVDLSYTGDVYQYVLMGLRSFEEKVESILKDISQQGNFAVQLVLTELVTNAYKHGNDRDMDLPIYIQVAIREKELFIEVKDLSIKDKSFSIIENISDQDLMSEGGRGLFLVKQFAKQVYLDQNAVIVEMNIGEV